MLPGKQVPQTQEKLNVLCLHGFRQNSKKMQKAMKGLKVHEFGNVICLNGCYEVADDAELRGWWELTTKEMINVPHIYNGDFIDYLGNSITVQPDVAIGFSQGAVALTILLANGMLPKCKKAILISGSMVMDERYACSEIIDIPSLHIIGNADPICPKELSESLAKLYNNAKLFYHDKGHVIPTKAEARTAVKMFSLA
jgi:predicted esterase